jgi:hypothetical protein
MKLNRLEPFRIITGTPGVRYIQGGKSFNCGGNLVEEVEPIVEEAVEEEAQTMFPCEWCGRMFKTPSAMKAHMTRMHPEDLNGDLS